MDEPIKNELHPAIVPGPDAETTQTAAAVLPVVRQTAAPASGSLAARTGIHEALSTPHDDFDWTVDKRNVTSYNRDERAKYDEVYDKTFKQINDNEMIHGTVVGL